jgi:xanthine dehydrogenase/oxidase
MLCAEALNVPLNKVTCTVKRLGGGFGGKESRACLLAVPAAVAAQKLQRTVRFQMDRDVDQVLSGQRHSFLGRYKLAVKRASLEFVAADINMYSNGGCSLDLSQPVLNRAMLHCTNACSVPSVRVRGHICKTNIPSNTAFRGFGGPQGMIVGETMFEHAARELGVSREALLRKNLYAPKARTFFGHSLTKSLSPDFVPLQQMWDQLIKQSDFDDRRRAAEAFNVANRYKKRGLAVVPTAFGISFTATQLNQAGALVHIQKDGSVLVSHGGTEMGQGLHTKLARVAANALNIPIEAVYVKETCTDTVANTTATAASSGTDLNGAAVQNACDELRGRLKPFLDVALLHGPVDRRQEALAKAAGTAFFHRVNLTAQGFHKTPIRGINWKNKGVNEMHGADPFWYYTYGVACSEGEVDCLTGNTTMLRTDIIHDVGRSINAAIDIGQVEGAFTQGVGLYMMEEVVYDSSGRLCSKGPGMYKIPGFGDVPLDFRVRLLEDHEGPAVMGSKAVGEPPLVLGSSVLYATKEAIYAARRDFRSEVEVSACTDIPATDEYFRLDPPATCEKIRMACLDFLNTTGTRTEWHARA